MGKHQEKSSVKSEIVEVTLIDKVAHIEPLEEVHVLVEDFPIIGYADQVISFIKDDHKALVENKFEFISIDIVETIGSIEKEEELLENSIVEKEEENLDLVDSTNSFIEEKEEISMVVVDAKDENELEFAKDDSHTSKNIELVDDQEDNFCFIKGTLLSLIQGPRVTDFMKDVVEELFEYLLVQLLLSGYE